MNLDLSGKTALVCGSTQGIGRAAAQELASLGATVILAARNADKLAEVAASLPRPAGQVHTWFAADFSQPEALETALRDFLAGFSGPVHILVNNTGGPPAGPAHTARIPDFEAAFRQHLVCNHLLVTALLPGMQAAGYGRVINVISTSVKVPLHNLGVSNTVRGAVANWAKTLANELAPHGITVNNVLPGATETERLTGIIQGRAQKTGRPEAEVAAEMLAEIPARRFGKAEDIAAAITFLASPAAGYINGVNLPVDGGRTGAL